MSEAANASADAFAQSAAEPAISYASRRSAFGLDADFDERRQRIWSLAERCQEGVVDRFWEKLSSAAGEAAVPDRRSREERLASGLAYFGGRFTRPLDQAWIDEICRQGRIIRAEGYPLPHTLAALNAGYELILRELFAVLIGDPGELLELTRTLYRLAQVEEELITSTINSLERERESERMTRSAQLFREEVALALDAAVDRIDQTSRRASEVADRARTVLDKAGRVAVNAEQSAAAMRGAAETAGRLVDAISVIQAQAAETSAVVEVASSQARASAKAADSLSSIAQTVDAIVALIKDVARQTRTLSLNASIEAARAEGDGRGFAVVAGEIKSLAGRTSEATDDVARQIVAIQSSIRHSSQAAQAIAAGLDQVERSAQRILGVSVEQAQIATTIAKSVDETSLAAEAISGLIADVLRDTSEVTEDMNEVERVVATMRDELSLLQTTASRFMRSMTTDLRDAAMFEGSAD